VVPSVIQGGEEDQRAEFESLEQRKEEESSCSCVRKTYPDPKLRTNLSRNCVQCVTVLYVE